MLNTRPRWAFQVMDPYSKWLISHHVTCFCLCACSCTWSHSRKTKRHFQGHNDPVFVAASQLSGWKCLLTHPAANKPSQATAPQKPVTHKLSVATCDDVSNGTANEGSSVKYERECQKTGLVVIPSERPPSETCHQSCGVPHEQFGHDLLPHCLLPGSQHVNNWAGVIGVVFFRKDRSHVVFVHLAVTQMKHRRKPHESKTLKNAQPANANVVFLLQNGNVGWHNDLRHCRKERESQQTRRSLRTRTAMIITTLKNTLTCSEDDTHKTIT